MTEKIISALLLSMIAGLMFFFISGGICLIVGVLNFQIALRLFVGGTMLVLPSFLYKTLTGENFIKWILQKIF